MVLTDLNKNATNPNGTTEIVYIGKCTAHQEHCFEMLRGATLLKECKGETGHEPLLQAIKRLNDECEQKLITTGFVRTFRCCTDGHLEKAGLTFRPYCEDPAHAKRSVYNLIRGSVRLCRSL